MADPTPAELEEMLAAVDKTLEVIERHEPGLEPEQRERLLDRVLAPMWRRR